MVEHTPGPWTTRDESVMADDGFVVARCAISSDREQGKADARLIASAPDLLASLILVTSDLEQALGQTFIFGGTKDAQTARAAIAKATGTETTDG